MHIMKMRMMHDYLVGITAPSAASAGRLPSRWSAGAFASMRVASGPQLNYIYTLLNISLQASFSETVRGAASSR